MCGNILIHLGWVEIKVEIEVTNGIKQGFKGSAILLEFVTYNIMKEIKKKKDSTMALCKLTVSSSDFAEILELQH